MGSKPSKAEPPPKEEPGGRYVPPKDFPTPALLAKAQADYTAAKVKVPKNAKGVPQPFPPPTNKAKAFNPAEYKYIDDHARNTPLDAAQGTYKDLVRHLVGPAKNDTAKVRAFFVWIGSQNPNRIFAQLGDRLPPHGSPLFELLVIMVKDYTGLFNALLHQLCTDAGIPCILSDCKAKGGNHKVGEPITAPGNRICLVYVDGAWRFIDQQWGSSSISAVPDAEWQMVEDGGGTQGGGGGGMQQTFYGIDEDWFFTDPHQLIYTHCCPDPKNQLLARPLTDQEFDQVAYLGTGFSKMEMSIASHPKCVIECADGTVNVEFALSKKKGQFFYNLYKSANDPNNDVFKGSNPKQFVFMETVKNKLTFKTEFPWIGKYKLSVECLVLEGPDSGSRLEVSEYLIHCRKPKFGAKPNPENSLDIWGLGPEMVLMGMAPVNHQGGYIKAEKGAAQVEFQYTAQASDMVQFTSTIHEYEPGRSATAASTSGQKKSKKSKHVIRYFRTEDDKIVVISRVQQLGKYILKIDMKDDIGMGSTSNYLLDADEGCTDLSYGFPATLDKSTQIGNLVKDDQIGLVPVSHTVPFIDVTDGKEITIDMIQSATGDLKLEPSLMLSEEAGKPGADESEYLFYEQGTNRKEHKFLIKFPRFGVYALNLISAKGGKRIPVYQYIINVKQPDPEAQPFPDRHASWKEGFHIHEPRDSSLGENRTIDFKFEIPGAKTVKLKGEKSTDLSKTTGDIWEGKVDTGNGGQVLNLVGEFGQSENILLTYQVLTHEELQQQDDDTKAAIDEADDKRKELDKKKAQEAKELEKRRKAEEAEIKKQEDDFVRNKDTYEAREKEIEQKQSQADQKEEIDYTKINLQDEMKEEGVGEDLSKAQKDAKLGWKDHHSKLNEQVVLGRLKEAIATRKLEKLQRAIADCEKVGIDNKDVKKARSLLQVEIAKSDLAKAMNDRNPQEIIAQIDKIRSNRNLMHHLQAHVNDAEHLLEKIARQEQKDQDSGVLDMDKKTLSEMRRYHNPPKSVHQVMQASLLLLGEDEEATEEWLAVQKLCNPTGRNNLNQRILDVDPSSIHPEIASRSYRILTNMNLKELQRQSKGAGTFYVWAMGILDEPNIDKSAKPADIPRQKEIFGRGKTEPGARSWEDHFNYKKTPRSSGAKSTSSGLEKI